MELTYILSFLAASALLTLMPGPDNIFVLTQSITRGPRHGVALTTGLVSGVLVHTLAAATGLSILLLNSALAFQIIKFLGAAYLLYLAFMAIREKPISIETTADHNALDYTGYYKKGFIMNVLNPKVSLFFIAFLPQFITPQGVSPVLQMSILGVLFMVQAWVIFSLIALLSGKFARYLNQPGFWTVTKWIKALILTALALTIAFSKNT